MSPTTRKVFERQIQVMAVRHTMEPRQVIGSLAVLFAQAAAINDHYQEIVAGWAARFCGSHTWCSVKRRERAIEKLYRSYQGDAACLLDLVRSSICFATVEQLHACLVAIMADESVA